MASVDAESEEDSPIEYYETCCVCDDEFYSCDEFFAHMIAHTEEEYYINAIKELEEKLENLNKPDYNSARTSSNYSLKRTYDQRSSSPEVLVISDDSDDESGNTSSSQSEPMLRQSRTLMPAQTTPTTALGIPMRAHSTPVRVQPAPVRTHTASLPVQRKTVRSLLMAAASGQIVKSPATALLNPGAQNVSLNCTRCNINFPDVKSYQQHALTHGKVRSYSCHICNRKFAFKATLRQHLHVHISESKHECKVCHKKFSLRKMLRQHEESHN